jgi:hypothetical protein
MKHRFCSLLLLLGTSVPALADSPQRSLVAEELPAPRALASALGYVPDECVAMVHVRVGALLEKFALKNRLEKMLPLDLLTAQFGLPVKNIDTFTLIGLPGEPGTMAFLIQTFKPMEGSIADQLAANGAKKINVEGKACVFAENLKMAICQINTQTLLIAPSKEYLASCLKQPRQNREEEGLAAALKVCEKHDLSVWFDLHQMTGMDTFQMLPKSIESGMFTLDLNADLAIRLEVQCDDEAGKEWLTKGLRAGVNLMRGQLLMVLGMMDGSSLLVGLGGDANNFIGDMQGMPLKLMRLAEKGFDTLKIQSGESSVTLTMTLPVDGKTLRGELLQLSKLFETTTSSGCATGSIGMPIGMFINTYSSDPTPIAMPTGTYLQHPPQYLAPTGGSFPIPSELASQLPSVPSSNNTVPQAIPQGIPTPAPSVPQKAMPIPQPNAQQLPPPLMPQAPTPTMPQMLPQAPTPTPQMLPPQTLPPQSIPTLPSQAPSVSPATYVTPTIPSAPPAMMKVSVANVRKDTATIFSMNAEGNMTFVQRVPAGEAVDLEVTAGTKWVAVFTDKPAAITKTISSGEKVWLLREVK